MRRVQKRASELTIQVVGVQRAAAAVSEEVRLAKLAVVHPAERVVDVHAPTIAYPAHGFHHEGVVSRSTLSDAMRQNVPELREGSEQLPARDGARSAECPKS